MIKKNDNNEIYKAADITKPFFFFAFSFLILISKYNNLHSLLKFWIKIMVVNDFMLTTDFTLPHVWMTNVVWWLFIVCKIVCYHFEEPLGVNPRLVPIQK